MPAARRSPTKTNVSRESRSSSLRGYAKNTLVFALCLVLGGLSVRLLRGAGDEAPRTGVVRDVARDESEHWLKNDFTTPVAPAALSGFVRDQAGAAIASARVCASCADCSLTDPPPATCTVSNERGEYALSAQARGGVIISASAALFAVGQANDGVPVSTDGTARSGLDITLQRSGARLAGTVVDALGGPVGAARVWTTRYERGVLPGIEVSTDEEGHFELWVSPGSQELHASAEGYASKSIIRVAPAEAITMVLTPASGVRGRVVLAGTDTPVAGVEVRARPALGGAPRAAPGLSDEDGEFVLNGLEPGLYSLAAEGESHRGGSRTELEIGLAEVVPEVTVEVVPAVSLIGRLSIGNDGKPCQRGTVSLGAPSATNATMVKGALSDDDANADPNSVPTTLANIEVDGKVRFKGLTRGRYQAVLHCQGHVLAEGPELIDVRDKNIEVDWKLKAGIGLTVHVVDQAGKSLPGTTIELLMTRSTSKAPPLGMALMSDARGQVEVGRILYPGVYTVQPLGGASAAPVTVELREGTEHKEVTLTLEGSASIVIVAHNAAQQAVDGLYIAARGADPVPPGAPPLGLIAALGTRAVSLGAGRYRVGPLAAGAYIVELRDGTNAPVLASGPQGARIELARGQELQLDVRLPATTRVSGTVVDESDQPAANVWVSASPEQSAASNSREPHAMLLPERARVITDDEGAFSLEGLVQGPRFRIDAKQPFGAEAAVRNIAADTSVRIVLPATGSIAGVVVDEQGKALPGFYLQATHTETGAVRLGRVVGAGGQFRVERVPAGAITVSVNDMKAADGEHKLSLRAGEHLEGVRLTVAAAPAELAQPAAADVTGRVSGATSGPNEQTPAVLGRSTAEGAQAKIGNAIGAH